MLRLSSFATVLTFGTLFTVIALVVYRLLWAAAGLSGTGMLPKNLQRWRRWLHGETANK